jgi:hypothetical protein
MGGLGLAIACWSVGEAFQVMAIPVTSSNHKYFYTATYAPFFLGVVEFCNQGNV